YLYFPLGGRRSGTLRQARNLMITMVLGGLWHGAAWHFVLWGAYHGGLLALHKLIVRDGPILRLPLRDALKIAGTFYLTCIGWLIFIISDGSVPSSGVNRARLP
ncbi:MAG: MBOAT family O-acyltransferase, partial [Vicinamibacteraceae bacterium]